MIAVTEVPGVRDKHWTSQSLENRVRLSITRSGIATGTTTRVGEKVITVFLATATCPRAGQLAGVNIRSLSTSFG
jgi:hypothetical protein